MAREGKDDSIDKPSRNKMVLDLLQTPLDSTHLALVSAPPPRSCMASTMHDV
jgi:hypothetical protein